MRFPEEFALDEDPYGPGADLVLSLFAVAILMVGLIGTGYSVQKSEEATKPTQTVVLLQRIKDLETEAERVKSIARVPPAPTTVSLAQQEIVRLRAELSALQGLREADNKRAGELENVNQEYARITKELRDLLQQTRKEVAAATPLVVSRIVEDPSRPLFRPCPNVVDADQFRICQTSPTAAALREIEADLSRRAAEIGRRGMKALVVEVRNSIEHVDRPLGRRDGDGSLELSTERSAAIVHYLASRGVPYTCLVSAGVGRARAAAVRELADDNGAFRRLDTILGPVPANSDRFRAADRVILITAMADQDTPCRSESLSSALTRLLTR